jgi:hypothetical protein
MYKSQPANPVDFLAKWLLNYSSVRQQAVAAQTEAKGLVKDLKEKHQYALKQEEKKAEVKKKEKMTRDERIKYFYETTIGESKDLTD